MRFDRTFSQTHTHALTVSSRPGLRGLKLQEMTMVLGSMGEEVWNVHLRRTSVPLTASISPDVYIRIPLTRSTPATYKHMAHQQSLLQKQNAEHTEQNQKLDRYIQCNRQMNSTSSVNSCLGSACSVPSDPTSTHTVLLQEKSLTQSCYYKCIR